MGHDTARERTARYAGDPSRAPGSLLLEPLRQARATIRTVADHDLAEIPVTALGDALDEVVKLERATAAVKARVIAAADRAGLAGQTGAVDTIAVLKDRARMSGRDAKRAVELGRRLRAMPGTAAALADGELGVEQAEQLARAVKKGRLGSARDVEASLLPSALTTSPEELAHEVKRREIDADGDRLLRDEQYARSRRALHTWREGGLHRGSWTADPVSGEYIESMIRALTTFDDPETPEELRRSPEQRRLDGLVDAAKLVLATGEALGVNNGQCQRTA